MRKLAWLFIMIFTLALFAGCAAEEPIVGEVVAPIPQADENLVKLPTGLLDTSFYEDEAAKNNYILLSADGKAGLADKQGNIVVQPNEYQTIEIRDPFILGARESDIDFLNTSGKKLNVAKVYGISHFYAGKAFAIVEDAYYWLHAGGNLERIEFEGTPRFIEKYGELSYSGDEFALSRQGYVAYVDAIGGAGTGLWIMSFDGNFLLEAAMIPGQPDDEYQIGIHDGLIFIKTPAGFGAMDFEGNLVIPFEYEDLKPAGDVGFIAKKGNKFGVISNTGEVVLPNEFVGIKEVRDGLAVFETNDVQKNGAVSLAGDVILQPEYEDIYIGEGRIVGKKDSNNGFVYAKNGVQVPIGSFTPVGRFSNGLVAVMDSNMKFGFAGMDGNIAIPCAYDEVGTFENGCAKVNKDGKWGVVDTKGNIVIQYNYSRIYGSVGFGFLLELENEWYFKSI